MKKLTIIFGILGIVTVMFLAFKAENNTNNGNDKISEFLRESISINSEKNYIVWVYLNDKGPDAMSKLSSPLSIVSEKSLERRRKVLPDNNLLDFTDIPVYENYVNEIRQNVSNVRVISKWLNSISVEASPSQIFELASKNYVRKIEKVERYRKINDIEDLNQNDASSFDNLKDDLDVDSLNYGTSTTQMTLIKANIPHNNGIFGQGIIIANFDAGYNNLNHETFTTLPMKIWKKKDFQDGDTVSLASHSHGQATLSLVGGYKPGQLISPAFMSTYVLCRTEVDPGETHLEMDYWIAAAEWSDSLGVDIITSSLGYLQFDPPYTSYSWTDMNGHTVPITIAADLAVHKGITVFNSAGNNGSNSSHNTLGAPADGDSVITIGATNSTGVRASYSSVGPTTDTPPRIKPDIMTQGSGNKVATSTGYSTFGSGTSWACPMAAGVGAQMLSANKNLTPIQIRDILRKFGNNSSSPNNSVGWGLVDAEKSVDSARKLDNVVPTIIHTQPFTNTSSTSVVTLKAIIKDNGIIRYSRSNEAPRIYYRKYNNGTWTSFTSVSYSSVNLDTFYFQIPGSGYVTTVEYYFAAQDIALPNALVSTLPSGGSGINPPGSTAPTSRFSYTVSPASIIKENSIPVEFKLYENYPNPFNPVTNIKFSIIETSQVKLNIYDISGRLIFEIVNMKLLPGVYTYQFNASELSSGVYFYSLDAGRNSAVNKMLLIN